MRAVHRVFISIGSNIKPAINVRAAVRIIGKLVDLRGISTFYITEPVGETEQPHFYNGVLEVETNIALRDLKYRVLRNVEEQMDRERTNDKYAPRTIDLDVLLYDDLVEHKEGLVVPDPDIHEREFLAIPLYELAPDLVMPDTGEPIAQIAERLRSGTMIPLTDYTERLRREVGDE